MFGYKLRFLLFYLSFLIVTARNKGYNGHKRNGFSQVNPFHSTQNVNDLVKNPTALSNDEASEINKLDSMSDVFMNPEVSSESQDLSRQGLDPYVAMQISKLDHNFQDIFGQRSANRAPSAMNAKQKGEILPGYGEQYNSDGSISLSKSEWPEYQLKDTPPMESMHKPGLDNMMLGNGLNSQQPLVSPQAALNPNLLPGQKSDLGMGMGVGMGAQGPGGPMLSRFANDGSVGSKPNKALMNPAFTKPKVKSAGFRIPGEFSFKNERKSAPQINEDESFVKNFMSSKKSHTEKRRKGKDGKQ